MAGDIVSVSRGGGRIRLRAASFNHDTPVVARTPIRKPAMEGVASKSVGRAGPIRPSSTRWRGERGGDGPRSGCARL